MARTDFKFAHHMRVRWAEVDKQGIVFNVHYLMYFDVAITEYYRALGYPYPEGLAQHGTDLYAKKVEMEYHASAGYDDEIDVCVRVARLGRSSLEFQLEVYRADQLLVGGRVVYVNANSKTRKSVALPDFLRTAIKAFEYTVPIDAVASPA